MTTQINQLTELTTTSDDDLILIREDSTGVDKRMKAQNLRAKATTKDDVGLGNVDNVSAADLRDRSTHTGTQPMSTISDAGTAATANTADLLSRANHTGTQTLATISDAGTIASQNANNVAITGGTINNTPIGGTIASTGAFTTASASTSVTTPLVTNAGTLGISATGSNIIAASTDGQERMRITSAGDVGIGTSNPLDILQANRIVQGSSSRSFLMMHKLAVSTGARNSTVLTITVPAGFFFLYGKMKYAVSRAMSNASTGRSRIGEYYFTIARNGSGSDVVIDEDIGNLSFNHQTTTAGAPAGFNADNTNPRVQRAGAELNTEPQVVIVIVNVNTAGFAGSSGSFAFELLGNLYRPGVVIT